MSALCPHCEDLQEQIAYLESELGLRLEADHLGALQRAFGLTRSEARIVLILHQARGRTVTKHQLEEAVGVDSASDGVGNLVSVYVCKIRKKLGHASIVTIWGNGHVLGAEMATAVSAVLAPRGPPKSTQAAA